MSDDQDNAGGAMKEAELMMQVVRVEAEKIDAVMKDDLSQLSAGVDSLLIEVLEYGLFNGGKRIRPLLVVLSARLCGCTDKRVYELARAFEYLHAATLFHDDVIDNAETRRGRPAVNRQFGLIPAILAGDFLHARSMQIVGELAGERGLSVFCEATAGMVDGEFMQLRNAEQCNLSEPDYYDAIMGKTGLLISAACEVGALFGGGNREQQERLKDYGVGLGCAFQMIDDLLDYTGDQQKTGKPVGNDLVEGKMTLPLIVALGAADTTDRTRLEHILSNPSLRQCEFSGVSNLIAKYDGFLTTRKRAEQKIVEALGHLNGFRGPTATRDIAVLEGLGHYVLSREK